MAKARARWRALDSETKDWLRWQLAVRVLETISACSNERVAGAIANLSEDDLSQLRVEIALGYQFVDNPSTEELPEILASGLTENPLDPPALLEACEEALMLPPHGLEELPNLRAVVRELYGIWRRDQLPGTPKVAAEAVVAIGDEIARRYRLPVDDARRRVRVNLRELDYRDQLPLR
ncbi:MAG: hypothetical protein KUG65_05780 [Sphingomonadaceae bacterium]|nr:hypothetical protein [Sphingomonadaceae bacterium]